MQIILEIEIYCKEHNKEGSLGVFQKEFNSDIIPSLGTKIIDRAFEGKAREIKEIIINYEQDWCFVGLIPESIDKEEHLNVYKTRYEPNGWKWSG